MRLIRQYSALQSYREIWTQTSMFEVVVTKILGVLQSESGTYFEPIHLVKHPFLIWKMWRDMIIWQKHEKVRVLLSPKSISTPTLLLKQIKHCSSQCRKQLRSDTACRLPSLDIAGLTKRKYDAKLKQVKLILVFRSIWTIIWCTSSLWKRHLSARCTVKLIVGQKVVTFVVPTEANQDAQGAH
jgi:hypothetical protein